MALPKLFQRIYWHNNTTPAINEDNLNSMSKAIDDIDNRVIDLGADVMESVPELQDMTDRLEAMVENPPYIGANGDWYVWDTTTGAYVDSGIDASITITIADVTTIAYGSTPYVTNTGTSSDPIFHLFIPRGSGVTSVTKTGTSGLVDTYRMAFDDGYHIDFTVTNGKSAYQSAVDGGYDGTEAQFNSDLADFRTLAQTASTAASNAAISASVASDAAEEVAEELGVLGNVVSSKGSVAFANLPNLDNVTGAWLYNITDAFTTDNRFIDGNNKKYNAGCNVVSVAAERTGTYTSGTTQNPYYLDWIIGKDYVGLDGDIQRNNGIAFATATLKAGKEYILQQRSHIVDDTASYALTGTMKLYVRGVGESSFIADIYLEEDDPDSDIAVIIESSNVDRDVVIGFRFTQYHFFDSQQFSVGLKENIEGNNVDILKYNYTYKWDVLTAPTGITRRQSATILAGGTTVTFYNMPTLSSATVNFIDFYTDKGVNYTAIDTSVSGQVTLTFPVQATDMAVYCELREVE